MQRKLTFPETESDKLFQKQFKIALALAILKCKPKNMSISEALDRIIGKK